MECNFTVGQKVVCVNDNWYLADMYVDRLPKNGEILTIRSIQVGAVCDGIFLRFEEIRNPPRKFQEFFAEIEFDSISFRPVVSKGMETLMSLLHKKPTDGPIEETKKKVELV